MRRVSLRLFFSALLLPHLVTGGDQRTRAEAILIVGGGTPARTRPGGRGRLEQRLNLSITQDRPERNLMLLRPDGRICKPDGMEMKKGLYGPGVATTETGLIICGGKTRGGEEGDPVNDKCWFWSEAETGSPNFELMEGSELPGIKQLLQINDNNGSCSKEGREFCFTGAIRMANYYRNPYKRNRLFVFVEGTEVMFKGVFYPVEKKIKWKRLDNERTGFPPKRRVSRSRGHLRSDPCLVLIGDHVLLIGGMSHERSDGFPALDYGMVLNLAKKGSKWATFPLLDPPRYGMGCALEMVFDKKQSKVVRKVLWLVGGTGRLTEESNHHEWSALPSPLIDTLRLDGASFGGHWLVGNESSKLRLPDDDRPRENPAFAILSTGQGTRKLVMSCSYGNGSVENSDCELSVEQVVSSDVTNIHVISNKVRSTLQDKAYFIPPKLTRYGIAVVPLSWFPNCSFDDHRFYSGAGSTRVAMLCMLACMALFLHCLRN